MSLHTLCLEHSPTLVTSYQHSRHASVKLIYSFAGNHNSKIYDYINSLSKNSSIPPTVTFQSKSASDDYEKATLFNSFFHSVFTESTFSLPATNTLPVPALNMGDIHVTEEEVYEALSALDPIKSSGIDGIGSKLLKHCALALYAPICHLFNLIITKHYLPLEWKLHVFSLNASSILRPLSISLIISNSPLAAQDQVHFTSWFIHLSKQTNQNTFTSASKLTSGITSWTI